ncbi:MAG: hypothetical protein H0Z38_03105 [Firmicutes bacterium]|nr:hypothetical protein [Bacillota bacterium]
MKDSTEAEIIAVVTTRDKADAVTGDIPVFVAADPQEKLAISTTLSRTTRSMIHELPNGVYILIRH